MFLLLSGLQTHKIRVLFLSKLVHITNEIIVALKMSFDYLIDAALQKPIAS